MACLTCINIVFCFFFIKCFQKVIYLIKTTFKHEKTDTNHPFADNLFNLIRLCSIPVDSKYSGKGWTHWLFYRDKGCVRGVEGAGLLL